MTKKKGRRFWLWLIPLMGIIAVMFSENIHYPIWMDEYVFYRLSGQFPDYHTEADWFYEDRPEVMNWSMNWEEMGFDYEKALRQVYDTPAYPHTPLFPMLTSPFVRGLNWLADQEIIPHIEEQPGSYPLPPIGDGLDDYHKALVDNVMAQRIETLTIFLRLFMLALFGVAMWLIYKMMQRRVGINALFCFIPIVINRVALSGIYLFYWDAFMMFFLVLTFYIMEFRPNSKWKYVTAACMVNTKMFVPLLFLLPLVIHAWHKGTFKDAFKMGLVAFSILPYYTVAAFITGDPFYPFNHYAPTVWIHNYMYEFFFDPQSILNVSVMGYLLMTLPILYYFKKFPSFAALLLVTLLYAWGTGLGVTHMSTQVYTGAMIFCLLAGEWHLMERVYRWLGVKRLEAAH